MTPHYPSFSSLSKFLITPAQALKYLFERIKRGKQPGAPSGLADWPRLKEWQKQLKPLAAIPDPLGRPKPLPGSKADHAVQLKALWSELIGAMWPHEM